MTGRYEVLCDLLEEAGEEAAALLTRWMQAHPERAIEAVDATRILRPWEQYNTAAIRPLLVPQKTISGGVQIGSTDGLEWTAYDGQVHPTRKLTYATLKAAYDETERLLTGEGWALAARDVRISTVGPPSRRYGGGPVTANGTIYYVIRVSRDRDVLQPVEHEVRDAYTGELHRCRHEMHSWAFRTDLNEPGVRLLISRPCRHRIVVAGDNVSEFALQILLESRDDQGRLQLEPRT